jgi:hypothetical protein
MSKKEEREYEEYEKLKNSKFKQQKLPGWRPVPSMARTVAIFFILGIVFAGLGVLILFFSNKIVEKIERYDNKEECKVGDKCTITIYINETMEKNIMVYYQLDGFYQNHRRYVKSKSEEQLTGHYISIEEMENKKDCDPIITNAQMGKEKSFNGEDLDPDEVAIPCGLMAKSYFNDNYTDWTFYMNKENNDIHEPVNVNQLNIARKADREKYKKNIDPSKQWINITDEHFLVWMRPSPLPNFAKLWGRIERDLPKDSKLEVTIQNNYDVTPFNGGKYLVLRTVNQFGGKNIYLAIGYIAFGGICIILGVIFIFGFKAQAKKEK